MKTGFNVEDLYSAIQRPETGGEQDTFIRTKADPRSSAYGDVQITYSTVQNLLNKNPELFDEDTRKYAERFVEQGKKFINANPNDPVYGLGGKGELGNTEEDKANYRKLANTLIQYEWNRAPGENPDAKLTNFIGQWRGAKESEDPRYYSSIRETLGAKPPTIQNFLSLKNNAPSEAQYAENSMQSNINTALDPQALLKYKVSKLQEYQPEERAMEGAKIGSAIGIAENGMIGGIIGSGVGALAGRALGNVQSGEYEVNKTVSDTIGKMNTLGIAKENTIVFPDGASFPITFDPDYRLENASNLLDGQSDRSMYDVDKSNPFVNRTTKVAEPLAYLLADALSKQGNSSGVINSKAINNTIGLLVNALQTDAKDINTIYARARDIASKIGLPESSVRAYFNSIKGKLDKDKASSIKQGLDILYA